MQPSTTPDLADAVPVTLTSCVARVSDIFARVFRALEGWRDQIAAAGPLREAELDALVERLVVPALGDAAPAADTAPGTLMIGAGFIAAPGFVTGREAHFAWWLGALAGTPRLGTTSAPSRRHPLDDYDRVPCPGTPFLIATRRRNASFGAL